MSDDLDELERVCKNNWRWPTCGEVLSLIERCRAAEAWIEYHKTERAEERDELHARLARWPEAVAKVRERYPESAFPPDGQSIDCKSARLARLICDEVSRLATEKRG